MPRPRPRKTTKSPTSPSARSSSAHLTLADSDFEVDVNPPLQSVALIFGDAGEGKTTLATRFAPGPLALINYDGRARPAVKVAREKYKREIHFTEVHYPADLSVLSNEEVRIQGQEALDKTMRNLEIAVRESERGNIRTIAIDTATELGDVISMAVTGGIESIKGDYGRSKNLINRQWWTIFDMARSGKAHFLVLARSKDVWLNNKPTGRSTYRGSTVLHDAVDWAGWMRLKKKKRTGAPLQEFELEIVKSGVNLAELGEVYGEEDWEDLGGPFAYSCMLQYEGTDLEDWL